MIVTHRCSWKILPSDVPENKYYLNVSFSRLITSVGNRELFFLLSNTRRVVVSVRMLFLFHWVLTKGCVV